MGARACAILVVFLCVGCTLVFCSREALRGLFWPKLLSVFPVIVLAGCASSALPSLDQADNAAASTSVQSSQAGVGLQTPSNSTFPPSEASSGGARGAAGAARTSSSTPNQGLITGFKGATLVLFNDETGNVGERVAVTSLALPLQSRSSPTNFNRVQIDTVYGPRWVARSEVLFGQAVTTR